MINCHETVFRSRDCSCEATTGLSNAQASIVAPCEAVDGLIGMIDLIGLQITM